MEIIDNLDFTLKEGELSITSDFSHYMIWFVLTDGKNIYEKISVINPIVELGNESGILSLIENNQASIVIEKYKNIIVDSINKLISLAHKKIKLISFSIDSLYEGIVKTILKTNKIDINKALILPYYLFFSPSILFKLLSNPFGSIVVINSEPFMLLKDKGGEILCGALVGLKKDTFSLVCKKGALLLFLNKTNKENNKIVALYGDREERLESYLKFKSVDYYIKDDSLLELLRLPYDKKYFSKLLEIKSSLRFVDIVENDMFQSYVSKA